ncbi:hypothetical protein EVA_11921 [gut metagenome]|uniref:Uncharacterized protein n=1 Tax=gut metagenome TaxID=749906 RepID=J9FZG5_9ZZZZ
MIFTNFPVGQEKHWQNYTKYSLFIHHLVIFLFHLSFWEV